MKKCSRCNQEKELSFFNKDKQRKDGHSHRCSACHSEVVKESKLRNPERTKKVAYKAHIKHMYGVDIKWVEQRLKEHNYKCKICSTDMQLHTNTVAIDHCHKTGKVRDIVCKKCNSAMGQFNDDPELIAKAIDYLKETKEI